MNEVWRDVKGYIGFYQVSNLGRVRSLGRTINYVSRHGTIASRYYDGKIINPTDNGHGYKIVGLRNGDSRRNYYVHRLVADAFIPNPFNLPEVNHKDANRANNRLDNLEWITKIENVRQGSLKRHTPRNLSKSSKTGEKYITTRSGKYRLNIAGFIDKMFDDVDKAIIARRMITESEEYKNRYTNKDNEVAI